MSSSSNSSVESDDGPLFPEDNLSTDTNISERFPKLPDLNPRRTLFGSPLKLKTISSPSSSANHQFSFSSDISKGFFGADVNLSAPLEPDLLREKPLSDSQVFHDMNFGTSSEPDSIRALSGTSATSAVTDEPHLPFKLSSSPAFSVASAEQSSLEAGSAPSTPLEAVTGVSFSPISTRGFIPPPPTFNSYRTEVEEHPYSPILYRDVDRDMSFGKPHEDRIRTGISASGREKKEKRVVSRRPRAKEPEQLSFGPQPPIPSLQFKLQRNMVKRSYQGMSYRRSSITLLMGIIRQLTHDIIELENELNTKLSSAEPVADHSQSTIVQTLNMPNVTRGIKMSRFLYPEISKNLFKYCFLSDLQTNGVNPESVRRVFSKFGRYEVPLFQYPRITEPDSRGARWSSSAENISSSVLKALSKEKVGLTREELAMKIGVERRRLSTALAPLVSLKIVIEKEKKGRSKKFVRNMKHEMAMFVMSDLLEGLLRVKNFTVDDDEGSIFDGISQIDNNETQ